MQNDHVERIFGARIQDGRVERRLAMQVATQRRRQELPPIQRNGQLMAMRGYKRCRL